MQQKNRLAVITVLVMILLIVTSGCMGIQFPTFPTNLPNMQTNIKPVPYNIVDAKAPAATPTANVTTVATPKPRFVYV